jgi:hypothetical protein
VFQRLRHLLTLGAQENYFENLLPIGESVSGWFVLWRKVIEFLGLGGSRRLPKFSAINAALNYTMHSSQVQPSLGNDRTRAPPLPSTDRTRTNPPPCPAVLHHASNQPPLRRTHPDGGTLRRCRSSAAADESPRNIVDPSEVI